MTWLNVVLRQEDRGKEERGKPESTGGTLMFSLKRETRFVQLPVETGRVRDIKGWFTLMIKAVAQQQEMQGGCGMLSVLSLELDKARPVGGLYHCAVTSN